MTQRTHRFSLHFDENNWDLGNKSISPIFVKLQGALVFLIDCGYLWKLHRHHAAAIWQAGMAALVTLLAVSLIVYWGMKTKKARAFFIFYQLILILSVVISLFALS
ncbi:MAG: hypothetical protein WB795_16295 [Candidatus Acidiferrales bacterium]